MVKLCNRSYSVSPELLESISARITAKLRESDQDDITYERVVYFLNTLYPSVKTKPWYQDFVVQFCSELKIPVRREFL